MKKKTLITLALSLLPYWQSASSSEPLRCFGHKLIDGRPAARVELKQSTFDPYFLDGEIEPISFVVDRYFLESRAVGMTVYDTSTDISSSGIVGIYRIPDTLIEVTTLNLYQFEPTGEPVQYQLNCSQKMN